MAAYKISLSQWGVFLTGLAVLGSASAPGEALRVATYNIQNYTLANRREGAVFRPAYPKPETEKAALRRVIAALDADVIALQEIGGEAFLRELRRDLASEGITYAYGEAMIAGDDERGLAVLSRVPLGHVTAHRDLAVKRKGVAPSDQVRRGILEVEVPLAGGTVTLFIVHLKSRITEMKEDPEAEDQRVAEAQAVRDMVLSRFPEPARARFLIVGDFNDQPGSRALKAIQDRGKTEITQWVDAADEQGYRWTHAYERIAVYSRLDHVFVSPGLSGSLDAPLRARIVGEPIEAVKLASDHRPIVVELNLTESTQKNAEPGKAPR